MFYDVIKTVPLLLTKCPGKCFYRLALVGPHQLFNAERIGRILVQQKHALWCGSWECYCNTELICGVK